MCLCNSIPLNSITPINRIVNFILPAGVHVPLQLIPTIPNCFSVCSTQHDLSKSTVYHNFYKVVSVITVSQLFSVLSVSCDGISPPLNLPQFLSYCVSLSDNLFHFSTECQRILSLSHPVTMTVFITIDVSCLNLNSTLIHFVMVFTTYSIFHVQIHRATAGPSPTSSQGRSGPTSLFLSVIIIWGLPH